GRELGDGCDTRSTPTECGLKSPVQQSKAKAVACGKQAGIGIVHANDVFLCRDRTGIAQAEQPMSRRSWESCLFPQVPLEPTGWAYSDRLQVRQIGRAFRHDQ